MRAYTDITLLIDRSGSMASCKEPMEAALRTFIKGHKKVHTTHLTAIQFDDLNLEEVTVLDRPIREVEPITIHPRGNTPLIDAFCQAIDRTGARLSRMPEVDRPDQVLFVIITDGQENASKKFHRSDLVARTRRQQDTYKWQFVYLGANQDAITEAQNYGLNPNFAATYVTTSGGIGSTAASITANTLSYSSNNAGARGMSTSLTFTDEDREKMLDQGNSVTFGGGSNLVTPKP